MTLLPKKQKFQEKKSFNVLLSQWVC